MCFIYKDISKISLYISVVSIYFPLMALWSLFRTIDILLIFSYNLFYYTLLAYKHKRLFMGDNYLTYFLVVSHSIVSNEPILMRWNNGCEPRANFIHILEHWFPHLFYKSARNDTFTANYDNKSATFHSVVIIF